MRSPPRSAGTARAAPNAGPDRRPRSWGSSQDSDHAGPKGEAIENLPGPPALVAAIRVSSSVLPERTEGESGKRHAGATFRARSGDRHAAASSSPTVCRTDPPIAVWGTGRAKADGGRRDRLHRANERTSCTAGATPSGARGGRLGATNGVCKIFESSKNGVNSSCSENRWLVKGWSLSCCVWKVS